LQLHPANYHVTIFLYLLNPIFRSRLADITTAFKSL